MAGPREYSRGTRTALAVLSRGHCYFPGCGEPVIRFVEDRPYVVVEIAHIRDAAPGNRYDPNMSDDDRRAFSNLILLCKPHHDLIDKEDPERFSPEDLLSWKAEREEDLGPILGQAEGLDEASIEDALKDAAINVTVSAGDLVLGGTGGSAPGSGGGGGGVIGSGTGGAGGPGGGFHIADDDVIVLDGTGGAAPCAGGGGGGALAPGSLVSPDRGVTQGRGYTDGVDGQNGGDTIVSDADGTVLVRAEGGAGALAGMDIRSTTDRLRVSALMAVDYAQMRDGLSFIAGGGWESCSALNLSDRLEVPLVVILEAGGVATGEYTVGVEAQDPAGAPQGRFTFPLIVQEEGDVLRVTRVWTLWVEVTSFGLWKVVVDHNARVLAAIDLMIKRTGEA